MTWIIITSIALLALSAALVLSRNFRVWLMDSLRAIGLIIAHYFPALSLWVARVIRTIARIIGGYSLFLLIASGFSLLLIVLALIIAKPGFIAFAFVVSLSLVLLAWLPAGLILKLFRVTSAVVPKAIKTFVAWVAFVGFLGLVMPEFTDVNVVSFRVFLGAALVAFIMLGVTAKINLLDKVIAPLVVVMCLALAWQNFFPEDFRSTTRYAKSWSKRVNTAKDRGSINNETDAATTYGITLKDVQVLYQFSADNGLEEIAYPLAGGTIVKISNHKSEVMELDGQGFVKILLAKENGSFVGGKKYWIEAEFVQIASPREIVSWEESLKEKPSPAQIAVKDSLFSPGTYFINVNGETPFYINIISNKTCNRYSLASQTGNGYIIAYDDGQNVYDEPGITVTFPNKERPRFKLKSQKQATIKMVVS